MTRSTATELRQHSPQGFAALLAILLLLLISSILAALGTMTAADARRARSQQTEAQLSQLLTAGAAVASRQMQYPTISTNSQVIRLPPELSHQQATLELSFQQPNPAGHIRVIVTASLGHHHIEQTLDFAPASTPQSGWKLESAALIAEPSVR